MTADHAETQARIPAEEIAAAVVRFAGDSGDGMQLAGTQFTDTAAILGNDVATLPDYPAEIRAPVGTVAGVSGFQVNFAGTSIHTPGDRVNTLVAMNPAAFKAHVDDVEPGGIVIANDSEFEKVNLRKAGYAEGYNPLDDEQFARRFRLYRIPITRLNQERLADSGLGARDIGRCKNMFALGVVYWLYDRPLDQTTSYIDDYFGRKKNLPQVAAANIQALRAGYFFGETAEMIPSRYRVAPAPMMPGTYRKISGNEAMAMGLVTVAHLAQKQLIYCSYPITPASDILHSLAPMRQYGVKTFQAEDEIAALCAAIGVAFAGQFGVTGTSGPGLALKSEAANLALMLELPVVIVNVQRGGPSTGLPTKTEQSDLLQALYGRNGDSPLVVLAPQSPADCFDIAIEAGRIAMQHMVPVIILSDGYLANGAEPWRIPDPDALDPIVVTHPTDPATYQAYARDNKLARPWAIPGTPGLEHRLGGLEKAHLTGDVSYDPENHQLMTELRHAKVRRVGAEVPAIEPHGHAAGDLLVLGWGGTYGTIITAVDRLAAAGHHVGAAHLRYLNPMPANLGQVLRRFKRILVPELNMGQLRGLIRGEFLVDARGLNKVQGKPFLVEELEQAMHLMLEDGFGDREYLMPRNQRVCLEDQEHAFTDSADQG